AFLPAIFAAMALSYILARPLIRRLKAMESFTMTLAGGEYEAPLVISGDGELGGVERGLESLRQKLRWLVTALSEDQKRLEALIDGVPDAVLLFGADGRLSAANRSARRLFHIPAQEWQALRQEEVVRDPRILSILDVALTPGGQPPEPIQVSWRDPELELEVICRPMDEEGGGQGALLVLRDVTRQARLERMRTDFIANMAHELFTPLTAIRGASETLIDSPAPMDPQNAKFLDTIHRHAIRLGAIVADVSQLSRIESGASPVAAANMDARRPAEDVAALFGPEAEKAAVAFGVEAPETPVELVSDAEKIESILVNLAQNGIRYTPAGGSVKISVLPRDGGGVIYQVMDTGVGIPFKDIPRVTERFYRVDPGRSRDKGGTGLGLSIVRHLTSALGGRMTIESHLGKGTTVIVELPSLPAPEEQ
ncbi:MAG: ATP-binding protein, partial [Nitrospinota bacterium]|nr:ATP-binding protein [Nitrospinota bacterium]